MPASPRRPGRPRAAEFTTPLTIPGGAVAGTEVVRELPAEVSLAVWQTLRSVLLWAAEEPAQRGDLFEPCAMEEWEMELLEDDWDPDVRCPLAVLVGELGRLGQASPETIARACLSVTEWALEHGYVATALGFAEAAGLAWPQHPRYAWLAGRLMRVHGRRREAEMWLKRAERAAAKAADWETRTLALNSIGITQAEAGNYRQAAQSHSQALRFARKHGQRHREGEFLHDLFVATAYMGDLDAAEEHARAALEIYTNTGHPRLLALAHDVAVLWMERGQFGRALPVFLETMQHFTKPNERILVVSSAARAAGACGEEDLYTRLSTEAQALECEIPSGGFVPRSLHLLGMGAWNLGRWDMAETLLARAESAAREQEDMDLAAKAGEALAAVREHRPNEAGLRLSDRLRSDREALAGRLVATLQKAPVLVTEGIRLHAA
jgi:tetratricopeptide (TPR) repeat protein